MAGARACYKYLQKADYYPYGMPWRTSETFDWAEEDGAESREVVPDRYLFGGKEYLSEDGRDEYYFLARNYIPSLPRFDRHDPKAESNYRKSPYIYCSNNPICRIDPDGMTDYYSKTNGKFLGSDNNKETSNVFRIIENENYKKYLNDITTLESLSEPITFDNNTIQNNINEVLQLTQELGVECQMYIYLDVEACEVSSIMGENGENTTSRIEGYPVKEKGLMTVDYKREKILIGELHGHPDNKDSNIDTKPMLSPQDINSAKTLQIPVYGMDAMKSSGEPGYIHLARPNGTTKNRVVKINDNSKKGYNIGRETLKIWGRSGTAQFDKMN